jgi:hypothetical protein
MSSFAFIGPNYFNSTTYNASSTAYNSEFPVYVDGTTATIPVNGSKYYGNVFGNVMCSFIVDGGDTILGGNLLLTLVVVSKLYQLLQQQAVILQRQLLVYQHSYRGRFYLTYTVLPLLYKLKSVLSHQHYWLRATHLQVQTHSTM